MQPNRTSYAGAMFVFTTKFKQSGATIETGKRVATTNEGSVIHKF